MSADITTLIEIANTTGQEQTVIIDNSHKASNKNYQQCTLAAHIPREIEKQIPPFLMDSKHYKSLADNQITMPQAASLPINTASPIDVMKEINRNVKIFKEYKENTIEHSRILRLQQKQFNLGQTEIIPIIKAGPTSTVAIDITPEMYDIVNEMHKITELDKEGLSIALLGAISIATWGRVNIQCDSNWFEPTIDMIIQVSNSGTRKTAAASILRKPFEDFQDESNFEISGSRERLKETKRQRKKFGDAYAGRSCRDYLESCFGRRISSEEDAEHEIFDVDTFKELADQATEVVLELQSDATAAVPVQLFIDCGTPYYTAKLMQEQGECLAAIADEGGILQSSLLSNKGAPKLFLKSHTQKPFFYPYGSIQLRKPSMPMINFVQENVAHQVYFNKDTLKQGVSERFVPYMHQGHSKDLPLNREAMFNNAFDYYNKKIQTMLKLYHTQNGNAEKFHVPMSSSAYKLAKEFEFEIKSMIKKDPLSPHSSCLNKAHGQAVRFAWDFHAWRFDDPHLVIIDEEDMRLGIAAMRYIIPQIQFFYDQEGLGAYANAISILNHYKNVREQFEINRLISEGTCSRIIQQGTRIRSKDTNNALRLLERHNYLAIYDDATGNFKVTFHPTFFAYIQI